MKIYFTILVALLLSACQKPKDWECTCKYDGAFGSGTETTTITNKTQSEASTACTNYGKSLTGGNGSYNCKSQVK